MNMLLNCSVPKCFLYHDIVVSNFTVTKVFRDAHFGLLTTASRTRADWNSSNEEKMDCIDRPMLEFITMSS